MNINDHIKLPNFSDEFVSFKYNDYYYFIDVETSTVTKSKQDNPKAHILCFTDVKIGEITFFIYLLDNYLDFNKSTVHYKSPYYDVSRIYFPLVSALHRKLDTHRLNDIETQYTNLYVSIRQIDTTGLEELITMYDTLIGELMSGYVPEDSNYYKLIIKVSERIFKLRISKHKNINPEHLESIVNSLLLIKDHDKFMAKIIDSLSFMGHTLSYSYAMYDSIVKSISYSINIEKAKKIEEEIHDYLKENEELNRDKTIDFIVGLF